MLIISFCPEVLIVNPVRNHLILAFNKENTVYIIQCSVTDFGGLYFGPSFSFSLKGSEYAFLQ